MTKKDEVAVMFSGGTDSTYAVLSQVPHFNNIRLITFTRKGLRKLENVFPGIKRLREAFPDTEIKVINSKNVTISLGLMVLEAARAARKGISEKEMDQLIDILIKNSKFFGAIENFKYLFSGGRAPFLGKFLSSAIKFKPILKK